MEHILRNAILALLDQPHATLADILRLLRDQEFRATVAANVQHEPVRQFWQAEFRAQHEAVAPIENKIGAFLSDPLVHRIVCKPTKQISFRRLMDERGVLLVNLAKGRIGEDSASILGGLIITTIGLATLSRIDTPETERVPFYLYIDEFQAYATTALANMIAELRKFKLGLILANQFLDQLDPAVRYAVLGNIGSLVCFRLGPKDAATMTAEYAPNIKALDLLSLPNHEIYVKLLIDGTVSRPFSARTLTPKEALLAHRERFLQGRQRTRSF